MDGNVSCDASLVTSEGYSASVGNLSSNSWTLHSRSCNHEFILSDIKNPIRAVQCLIEDCIEPSDAYLCPSLFLVGPYAEKYALSKGLPQASLISSTATEQWKAWRGLISDCKTIPLPRLDTIGAMLLFADTSIASCSSGGLILKSPGRIGHVKYLRLLSFYFLLIT